MEAFPMKSGDGPQSYAQNSSYQGVGVIISLAMVREAIAKDDTLYMDRLRSWATFRIADLGCSSGPNTFAVAHELVDSMGLKYEAHGLAPPDFQVFFNDHATNDFNTLFTSLPAGADGRLRYFPAGVPGSFHARLFPRSSLHLVYSSYTLHWLSQVPVSVRDGSSSAWNKGRIYLTGAPEMVVRAYEDQYKEDVEKFLGAKAEEVVAGGCMALVVACVGDGVAKGDSPLARLIHLVGSTLMEMSAKGIVDEAKVDSFNVPFYLPSMKELERSVTENGCFSIVNVRRLFDSSGKVTLSSGEVNRHLRAVLETLLCDHFGGDILNQVFDLTLPKLEKIIGSIFDLVPEDYLMLLKRNYN